MSRREGIRREICEAFSERGVDLDRSDHRRIVKAALDVVVEESGTAAWPHIIRMVVEGRGGADGGDGYLSADQVAERLGVSLATVQRWCRDGEVRASKAGRQWVITEDALDEFLQS